MACRFYARLGLYQPFLIDLERRRPLTRDVLSDSTAADMTEMIISLAHKSDLRAIAEGIETAKQLDRLIQPVANSDGAVFRTRSRRRLHVDLGAGFPVLLAAISNEKN